MKGGAAALAGLTCRGWLAPRTPSLATLAKEKGHWDDDQSDFEQPFVHPGGEVIDWLDQPPANPVPDIIGNLLEWEALDSFLTPPEEFFYVKHYGLPDGLDEAAWRVGIGGLVARPQSLASGGPQSPPPHEVDFTLECSGNADTSVDFFIGGVGTARWGGARLAPLLEEAGVLDEATEVVF